MAIDLLTTDFRIPEPRIAHIVGTGPNGYDQLHRLKDAQFVIVVNRAIDYDWIPRHLWLCDDGTLPEKEWFRKNVFYYTRACVDEPLESPYPTLVFSEGKLLDTYPDVPYYVRHSPGFYTDPPGCWPGVLRGGTSVGGKGAQFAYHLGAKRIVLCGIDMKGKAYANDPEGHGCNANLRGDGTWAQLKNFNRLIKWLQGQGVEVVSLSETALEMIAEREDNAFTSRTARFVTTQVWPAFLKFKNKHGHPPKYLVLPMDKLTDVHRIIEREHYVTPSESDLRCVDDEPLESPYPTMELRWSGQEGDGDWWVGDEDPQVGG